jgi:hypothetical protein
LKELTGRRAARGTLADKSKRDSWGKGETRKGKEDWREGKKEAKSRREEK